MKPVIAVDGPAGSGKSTLARKLADYFKFAHLDTGILYRIVAHMNVTLDKISDLSIQNFQKISKEIPENILRSDAVSKKASKIANSPRIREIITNLQRDFAINLEDKYLGAILDGRDIGTVVVPNASCKIFITADLKIRAERRWSALKQTNPRVIYEEVYKNLAARDYQDLSRKIAPLTFDESYILINTSSETIEISFAKAIKTVEDCLLSTN